MSDGGGALVWSRDGRDWPNREHSDFVMAGGITWHVQRFGQGPAALLVHGTGASTHSWAGIAPLLSPHFSLIAIDLPGHAFTSSVPGARMTLPEISSALGALVSQLRVAPTLAIGHSAGAAILARMALDRLIAPELIVSVNGALMPFPGFASQLFPAMAKALFVNPLTTRYFTWRAGRAGAIERLIEGTGSRIPERSLACYQRLFRAPSHVAGALSMMANWSIAPLGRDLPRAAARLMLITGSNDRAIPPDRAFQLAKRLPRAEVKVLLGLGHLAHEEDPQAVASLILEAMANR